MPVYESFVRTYTRENSPVLIEVRQAQRADAPLLARLYHTIGGAAYSRAYEQTAAEPDRPLSRGKVRAYLFDPKRALERGWIHRDERRIRSETRQGTRYWLARERSQLVTAPGVQYDTAALLKTSMRRDKLKPWERTIEVNDALTSPAHQRQGLATALLHTVLSGARPGDRLALHVIDANDEFNEHLRFVLPLPEQHQIGSLAVGQQDRLERTELASPDALAALELLETHSPWLKPAGSS